MAQTLEEIVVKVLSTETAALKKLKEDAGTAKTNYEEALKKTDRTDTETKKGLYEKAQKDFDDKFTSFINRIRDTVNEEREKGDLAIYSSEVAERRKNRKKNDVEEQISKAQGSIDVLTLQIDAIDKDIEEVRKGLVPAKTA
jgi:hypothetical protein